MEAPDLDGRAGSLIQGPSMGGEPPWQSAWMPADRPRPEGPRARSSFKTECTIRACRGTGEGRPPEPWLWASCAPWHYWQFTQPGCIRQRRAWKTELCLEGRPASTPEVGKGRHREVFLAAAASALGTAGALPSPLLPCTRGKGWALWPAQGVPGQRYGNSPGFRTASPLIGTQFH